MALCPLQMNIPNDTEEGGKRKLSLIKSPKRAEICTVKIAHLLQQIVFRVNKINQIMVDALLY